MRFNVEGADESTGTERVVELDAADERQAEWLARSQGLLVSAVHRSAVADIDYRGPSVRSISAPNYGGLVLGGGILRILGALMMIGGAALAGLTLVAGVATRGPQGNALMIASLAALYPLAAGGVTYALGEACYALRDIARNSWR